jgi:hypothetical protein
MDAVDGIEVFKQRRDTPPQRYLTRLTSRIQSYDAINEPLVEPFSRLGTTEAEILEFAIKYGHLAETVRIVRSDLNVKSQTVGKGELVSFWRQEVRAFQDIYRLFGAWRRREAEELQKRIIWSSKKQAVKAVEVHLPSGAHVEIANSMFTADIERLRQFDFGDLHGPAIFHVQMTINKYLQDHTATRLLWGMEFAKQSRRFANLDAERHAPSLMLIPKNLLGAIWLQFAKLIDSRSRMQRCVTCRNLFSIGGGRQNARRADARCCSDRCRWGQRKFARDLSKQGCPIQEIAKALQQSQSVVKSWVTHRRHSR